MSNYIYVFLFILSVLIGSISQIILKKGAEQKNIYINKYTILGYTLMLLSTLLTFFAYKFINLSMGAVLQSLSFIFVAIFSRWLLKENISKITIIGMVFIICGIVVFSI